LLIPLRAMRGWELVRVEERLLGLLNSVRRGVGGIYWFSQRSVLLSFVLTLPLSFFLLLLFSSSSFSSFPHLSRYTRTLSPFLKYRRQIAWSWGLLAGKHKYPHNRRPNPKHPHNAPSPLRPTRCYPGSIQNRLRRRNMGNCGYRFRSHWGLVV
jgi:hypothetical protein